jgi:PAS domain S-box-containing protein
MSQSLDEIRSTVPVAATGKEELDGLGVSFRRPKLMIIDDEPAVLDLLEGYFHGEGYDVRLFHDPQAALNAMSKHPPDAALVDCKMPGLDGLQLIAEGRQVCSDTAFIVITGHATVDALLDAIRQGVDDYLTKPFSSEDTVRLVVRNALTKKRLQSLVRMQATVTGTVLKLAEMSCLGEGRKAFFAAAQAVFSKLLDASAVGLLYRHKLRLDCHIASVLPMSPEAASQIRLFASEKMGLGKSGLAARLNVELIYPDSTAPIATRFGTLLPLSLTGLDGVEAQIVVAHQLPDVFSKEAIGTAVALARNISIIIQRQMMGVSQEHQFIADLFHNLKDGVVVFDREFKVRFVNPQARRFLGMSPEAPMQVALELLSKVDKGLGDAHTSQSFRSAVQKQAIISVDGEERFFDVEAYAFHTPTQVGYRMISLRDVTHIREEKRKILRLNQKLKSLNQELLDQNRRLETVNKELDSFAYIASHDLQEPFKHIEIFSQYLVRDLAGVGTLPDEITYHVSQISQNVQNATTLLADLRTLSKITRMRNPQRMVPMVELVEEVLDRFSSAIAQSGAEVTVEELPDVKCDPIKMKEVFHNLLSNALKYCEGQPKVKISAQNGDHGTTVSVKDNGIGIDSQYHEYIFQPCRRIPFRESERGSGLGLAIVKKIVEEHGGQVWVESKKGAGADFRFTIPVA